MPGRNATGEPLPALLVALRLVALLVSRRVVLTVLLVVQPGGLLLGHVPGLPAVQVTVAALVEVLVHLRGGEAGDHFLAERVMLDDAFALAVVLVHPHCLEASGAGQQFVCYIPVLHPAVVHLTVRLTSAQHVKESHGRKAIALWPGYPHIPGELFPGPARGPGRSSRCRHRAPARSACRRRERRARQRAASRWLAAGRGNPRPSGPGGFPDHRCARSA